MPSSKKLLELFNEFGNVAGYKINIQISAEYLYINKRPEREIQETILFTIALKRIKYWGTTLRKQNLCSKNYKCWWEKSKQTQEHGKTYMFVGRKNQYC